MQERILLVEDDAFLCEGLYDVLCREGYLPDTAPDLQRAQEKLSTEAYQLVILDVMLPDGSGVAFCEKLRRQGSRLPILMLTACDEEYQIVRGLDAGADDYMTKPFSLAEFLSRVRARLRQGGGNEPVFGGGVSVDLTRRTVTKDGEMVFVTPTEFQILSCLLRHRGQIVTRNALLSEIWDADGNFIDDNTLSVHISRLREKIGAGHIATVRGFGYRWEDDI